MLWIAFGLFNSVTNRSPVKRTPGTEGSINHIEEQRIIDHTLWEATQVRIALGRAAAWNGDKRSPTTHCLPDYCRVINAAVESTRGSIKGKWDTRKLLGQQQKPRWRMPGEKHDLGSLTSKRENQINVLMELSDSPGVISQLRSIDNKMAEKMLRREFLRGQLRTGIGSALDFLGGIKADTICFMDIWVKGSTRERQGVARSIGNWIRVSPDRTSFQGEYSPIFSVQSFHSGGDPAVGGVRFPS